MLKSNVSIACPVCGEGEFKPFSDGTYSFRHGKKTYIVEGQQYAKCPLCETSGYLPNQRAANFESIAKFQATLTDYVSPSDVLAVRERYSLTQKQAAQIFKGGVNGFSKWERGATFPSASTAMLIKVALASFEAMKELARIAQVDFPIIDQKATDRDFSFGSTPARMVVSCTHMEYQDDVAAAEAIDNECDNENDEEWITWREKIATRTTSFHS